MPLFFYDFNVTNRDLVLDMNRGEIVSGKSCCGKRHGGVVHIHMAEVCNIEHLSQAFFASLLGTLVLAYHDAVKVKENPAQFGVISIFRREHPLRWIPSLQFVHQANKPICSFMTAGPCLAGRCIKDTEANGIVVKHGCRKEGSLFALKEPFFIQTSWRKDTCNNTFEEFCTFSQCVFLFSNGHLVPSSQHGSKMVF